MGDKKQLRIPTRGVAIPGSFLRRRYPRAGWGNWWLDPKLRTRAYSFIVRRGSAQQILEQDVQLLIAYRESEKDTRIGM